MLNVAFAALLLQRIVRSPRGYSITNICILFPSVLLL